MNSNQAAALQKGNTVVFNFRDGRTIKGIVRSRYSRGLNAHIAIEWDDGFRISYHSRNMGQIELWRPSEVLHTEDLL